MIIRLWNMDEIALALVSFLEAIFLPLPPDALLIPLSLVHPEKAIFYAGIATVFSAIGGFVGYKIGKWLRNPLKEWLKEKLTLVERHYAKHGDVAVLLSALTPIPYKIFTLSSGVLNYPLRPFLLFSVLGRGIRFLIVSLLGQSPLGLLILGILVVGYVIKKYIVGRITAPK
jgi:membrane protein YqaA with SNARE-associated domain